MHSSARAVIAPMRRQRREGLRPRLVEEEGDRKHHQRARGQLAGRHRHRRKAHAPEPARPDRGQRIAERRGDAGELRKHVACRCSRAGPGRSSSRHPPKPSRTPAILRGVMRSSCVNRCATTTPQIGVVALRIDARPLAICVWPHPNRVNGMALLSSASRNIEPQTSRGRPSGCPLTFRNSQHRDGGDGQRAARRRSAVHVADGDADEHEGAAPDDARARAGSASRNGS